MKYIYEDRAIPFSSLKRLPTNVTILALVTVEDMGGEMVDCMLVYAFERGLGARKFYCRIDNGEYVAEHCD